MIYFQNFQCDIITYNGTLLHEISVTLYFRNFEKIAKLKYHENLLLRKLSDVLLKLNNFQLRCETLLRMISSHLL